MREIRVEELNINPYTLFSKNWAALCSGNEKSGFNAMTIAWGQIGSLWERKSHSNRLPVATVYVRPSRYTKQLMDENRDEGFIDREIVSFNYPEKDFHRVYVGEIIKVLE